MVKLISVTQLRERVGEYLDRADYSTEAFLVTRAGRGKAILVSAAEYLRLIEERDALRAGKRPPQSKQPEPTVTKEQLKALLA